MSTLFLDAFKEAGNYNDDAEIGLEEDLSSSDDELLEYKDPSKYKKAKMEQTAKLEVQEHEIVDLTSNHENKKLKIPVYKEEETSLDYMPLEALSDEQYSVYDLIVNKGENVFFTGPAGSGKTTLLKTIINGLRKKYDAFSGVSAYRVGVTASTGLAAMNLKGKTFHSFLNIGLGTLPAKTIADRIKNKDFINGVWYGLQVLIIDECSLINCKLFDKLNEVAKLVKSNNSPFGGIQLILVGDFYQLPPIIENFDVLSKIGTVVDRADYDDFKSHRFAFCSSSWKECIKYEIELKEVHRQKTDSKFIEYLNEIRKGNITGEINEEMNKLSRELNPVEGVKPTYLFPTKAKANNYNSEQMNKIKSKMFKYKAETTGKLKGTSEFMKMADSCILPEFLNLKVGSQVMLVKNQFQHHLVNGTKGVVVDFIEIPFGIESIPDEINIPKKPKIKTVDGLLGNVKSFDLSNPKNFIGVFSPNAYDIRNFSQKSNSQAKSFPVVKFLRDPSDPTSTITVLVGVEEYSLEDVKKQEVLFCMSQIPLILSWAISIHKSQGQTYNFMKADLKNSFEFGQCYVAISRVTSRQGLQLLGWNKSLVKVNELVNAFYQRLKSSSVLNSKSHPDMVPYVEISSSGTEDEW